MPFHNPTPDSERPVKKSGALNSYVQAEKLMQIAFMLPCAAVIGWGLGWLVDRQFHSHWATVTGLIFGLIAGMVSVIRIAVNAMNSLSGKDRK